MAARTFKFSVFGAELIARQLKTAVRVVRFTLARGVSLSAADLLARSANLAPILRGDLIRSGRVIKRDSSRRFRRTVAYGTDHAVFAHEEITPAGPRGLGPLSSQKPGTADGVVGGHFLSRPFRKHRRRYEMFIRDELKRGLNSALPGSL